MVKRDTETAETVLLSSVWPMCHIHMSERLVMAVALNDGLGGANECDGCR